MADFTMGVVIGLLATVLVFISLEFTPRVDYADTLRAVQVCKDGKWEWISGKTITCSDSAKYKLQGDK